MKRLATLTLMAAVASGCAMFDQAPARTRRVGEANAKQTPKPSPFQALAARMNGRKAKAAAAKDASMQSDDDGPTLPDVKPASEEKVQAVATISGSTPAYLPDKPEPVTKPTSKSVLRTGKKTPAESPSGGVASANETAAATPSNLSIQLTSNQSLESADPKTTGSSGPSLSATPASNRESKPLPSGAPSKMPAGAVEQTDIKPIPAATHKKTSATTEVADSKQTAPAVRMVNSKRVSLNYEVKDVGPSGVSAVELWYTQDGRKWEKCDASPSPNPPFVVDVKDEGLYGFTLVARSGIGLGKRPPRPGDLPQVWVEVDMTKPVVKLIDLQVGVSSDTQHLTIMWKATDKNFGPRPIALSFAEQADGPWSQIAGHVENSGSYVWRLPAGIPHRFYVRVEATDLVGNSSFAQTGEPILIDLSQPTVAITTVEAGK